MPIELSSLVPKKTANHQNFGHCSDVFHERWHMAHGVPLRRETARVSHRPLTRERLGPRDHFPMLHECHFLPRHMLQLKLMSPHRHSSINVTPNKNKHSNCIDIVNGFHIRVKYQIYTYTYIYNTLPETNIAPEIGPSQKEIHLPTIHFQGLC